MIIVMRIQQNYNVPAKLTFCNIVSCRAQEIEAVSRSVMLEYFCQTTRRHITENSNNPLCSITYLSSLNMETSCFSICSYFHFRLHDVTYHKGNFPFCKIASSKCVTREQKKRRGYKRN
jgi:hypothetical protein